MDWTPIQKPAEQAERRLLEAILDGHFPINTSLPAERDLAKEIGVTRPTLREALQRLARDGWLDIQQGKPTRVCDYWHEGSLPVLSVLAQSADADSLDFSVHLLEVRLLIAPAYARQAISNTPQLIIKLLEELLMLEENPAFYARGDWELHSLMTHGSSNPIFQMLLNGFKKLYLLVGEKYFSYSKCRQHSQAYYRALLKCARRKSGAEAESLTRQVMEESLALARSMQGEITEMNGVLE